MHVTGCDKGFRSGFGPRGGKTAIHNSVGGIALSTSTELDNVGSKGGAKIDPRGGECSPPAPTLKVYKTIPGSSKQFCVPMGSAITQHNYYIHNIFLNSQDASSHKESILKLSLMHPQTS